MDAAFLDQPRPVRPGEELDAARLAAYLAAHLSDPAGPLEVSQFPQGYSNLTYLLRMGDQELVLRRPPPGVAIRSAHDMGREYRVLAALAPIYPRVPRPLLYCDDPAVLGAPFYVMERVPGVILRARLPAGLALDPAVCTRLSAAFVDNLVTIHALPLEGLGLGDRSRAGGYIARQVEGWTARYAAARTDDIPDLERVAAWLGDHIPPSADATLIHNDYKHDNLVLDPTDLAAIRAVLDWEMATVGDPLMDLGTTLGYWVEAADAPDLQRWRFGPTTLPGTLTRTALVARYAAASGRDVSNIVYYYVYGLFKIAGIAQQIYARHVRGLSTDPRFAGLIGAIRALGRTAALAFARGRIDHLEV